ncbi:MAG: DHH family phosphoesterase [Planctomycetes bacterium]|nr:DHH family phosphoesterase [Planctomycetota bacterium]
MLKEIVSLFQNSRKIALTTHIAPDGDAISSELSLFRALRRLGKIVRILNCGEIPSEYRFLTLGGEIEQYSPETHDDWINDVDLIVSLDIGSARRLGPLYTPVKYSRGVKLSIDHHPVTDEFYDRYYICLEASSTSEIIYTFVSELGVNLDRSIAEPMYCGIEADTQSFRLAGTTSVCHQIVSELIDTGIRAEEIHHRVHCEKSLERRLLFAEGLSKIQLASSGQIAWIEIDHGMIARYDVSCEEALDLVNEPLTIRGVEVGLFFLASKEDETRVSLRSRGRVDVARIARGFGGGGHRHAAGLIYEGTTEDAVKDLLPQVQMQFESQLGVSHPIFAQRAKSAKA